MMPALDTLAASPRTRSGVRALAPWLSGALASLCLLASVTVRAADGEPAMVGDAAAGQSRSAVCAACHGVDGKALQPAYPNLAGQHPSYLAKQLTDYREGERVNALMTGQAAGLSDQDILDLAAWFGAMDVIPGVASDEDLALGESIYRGGITSAKIPACIGCHSPAGLGNPAAVYPSLTGQNAGYTIDQLTQWRNGTRNNDPNNVMGSLSHRLTDPEIAAVANYIQGLY